MAQAGRSCRDAWPTIEPLNDEIVRMLANGQRMAKKETQANKTATQVISMPVDGHGHPVRTNR